MSQQPTADPGGSNVTQSTLAPPNTSRLVEHMQRVHSDLASYAEELYTEIKSTASAREMLSSNTFWIFLFIGLFSAAMFARGLSFPTTCLVVLSSGFLHFLLVPYTGTINRHFNSILEFLGIDANKNVVYKALWNPKVQVLIATLLLATVICTVVYSWAKNIGIVLLVLQILTALNVLCPGIKEYNLVITLVIGVILFLFLRVLIGKIEKILLACIFSANGALVLITIAFIVFGTEKKFRLFEDTFDIKDLRTFVPTPYFFVWLVVVFAGVLLQFAGRSPAKE